MSVMKKVILLGSTGSVGRSVLDIVRQFPDRYRISVLAGKNNTELLSRQAEEFRPDKVVIEDRSAYTRLRDAVPPRTEVLCGAEEVENVSRSAEGELLFMAISGTASLRPLVAALESGRAVALASKEPVVSAGHLIRRLLDSSDGSIIPVDSEHSAVMQCLTGRRVSDVRTVYLTGSGGPLRGMKGADFKDLTVEKVLDHPKWDMGPKITVDSATLMNKGLEVIEARWLFNIPRERIKVVIHPEALVHSLVEFNDGTLNASMFCPDMRFPILRALSYPGIISSELPRIDPVSFGNLTFEPPDREAFPGLDLCYEALSGGGTLPAVLN
ncbi:MAG: 1-deoxy-D-xylulose-5-phosphate reductoisomerase, partial [Candidatus Omnitrophica bacterium]|nr:1-deoxy-D-xylulose-5-phosphate reductoisomerase [Candidatus Omnitrophota bacterium]